MPPITISQLRAVFSPANQATHVDNLGNYFTWNGTGRSGSLFETFGGRGDTGPDSDRFTYADCLAPSFLDAPMPVLGAHRLAEGDLAQPSQSLLTLIPANVPLDSTQWVNFGSTIDNLFQQLKTIDGVAWVIASKLIARKRPQLVPIQDRVLYDAFGYAETCLAADTWEHLASLVSDSQIKTALKAIQNAAIGQFTPALYPQALNLAGLSTLSLIRILDICVWEEHHGHKGNKPATCLF
jgi:Family of unknown function (DUF6308)